MSVSVCVYLSMIISSEPHVRSSPIFCACYLWPWLSLIPYVLTGFMDDVIFARNPRLLDVAAQLKRSAHAVLGLAINCAL